MKYLTLIAALALAACTDPNTGEPYPNAFNSPAYANGMQTWASGIRPYQPPPVPAYSGPGYVSCNRFGNMVVCN